MARIRTIKPEFFTSEDVVNLSPLARLFYIGLWCECDREGRLDWKVGTLKMRYLPGDDCSIESIASELVKAGLVAIYEVDGKQYAEIPTFKKHQVINNRESESSRPSRVVDACTTRESGRERKEGKGMEGNGKGKEGREGSISTQAKAGPISAEAWDGYSSAYKNRYGTQPVRNAKVNGQLAQLVGRLGSESGDVARFYVAHQGQMYVRAMHPVDLLLRDAEKLRTEWATNRTMTETRARQADKTQANYSVFKTLLDEQGVIDAE